MTAASAAEYPVRFDCAYPEGENRFMILARWALALPHWIIVNILVDLVQLLAFFAFFAILFTGRYPRGMFRLAVGFQRWNYNVITYALFHGRYPPFSVDDGEYPPLSFDIEYPQRLNRWLPFVKWLLAFPHYIVLAVLAVLGIFVYLFVWVAVLVTGRYPRGAFDFLIGVGRWWARVTAYIYLMTDRYPPFSLR